jgi:hypothetical protein
MSETSELISTWLKDEFPKAGWETHGESVSGVIGGVTLELKIMQKELLVSIWTKLPFKKSSKVREVHLTNPTSIDDLQEVVRHTIKITTNPFLVPPNAHP